MPWSKKQVRAAHAVEAGAKVGGMTKDFAAQVISEGQRKKKAESMLGKGARPGIKR